MGVRPPKELARPSDDAVSHGRLLVSLLQRHRLAAVVPLVLDILAEDPLASGGRFPGDLLRGLMEVPSRFWGQHPQLYERYRVALRAGASARRHLPPEERLQFWRPLDGPTGDRGPAPGGEGE